MRLLHVLCDSIIWRFSWKSNGGGCLWRTELWCRQGRKRCCLALGISSGDQREGPCPLCCSDWGHWNTPNSRHKITGKRRQWPDLSLTSFKVADFKKKAKQINVTTFVLEHLWDTLGESKKSLRTLQDEALWEEALGTLLGPSRRKVQWKEIMFTSDCQGWGRLD